MMFKITGPAVVHVEHNRFDVYVGRNKRYGDPKWGNPYSHLRTSHTAAKIHVSNQVEAVLRYAAWLREQKQLVDSLGELWGKTLGCHCCVKPVMLSDEYMQQRLIRPPICHGEILMVRANDPTTNPAITERFWVSGKLPRASADSASTFTCFVGVDDYSKIIWTADVLKTFIGQDIQNLIDWGQCQVDLIRA